jgi:acetyl esterase/lipase
MPGFESSNGNVNADRIAIMGHSAGAYLALVCGFKLDPRPAVVVSISGYGKLVTDEFAAPGPHYLAEHESVSELDARLKVGGAFSQIAEFLQRHV